MIGADRRVLDFAVVTGDDACSSDRQERAVGEVVYTSRVSVVREGGPVRTARLPGRDEPVTFGVHGAIAEHYGVDRGDHPEDATTIDFLVAAAGG